MAQTQMYKGKATTIVRDVKSGDADFVQGQDEIVIRLDNGTEKKVARAEVTTVNS